LSSIKGRIAAREDRCDRSGRIEILIQKEPDDAAEIGIKLYCSDEFGGVCLEVREEGQAVEVSTA
jgi:hypothetical protein